MNKLWLWICSFFMTEEQLIEYQLKNQFKPRRTPKIITCEYCNKKMRRGSRWKEGDPFFIWVDGNRNTTYTCPECEEYITQKRNEAIKDLCICIKWNTEPTIERCLNCQDREECEKLLNEAEELAKLEKKRR